MRRVFCEEKRICHVEVDYRSKAHEKIGYWFLKPIPLLAYQLAFRMCKALACIPIGIKNA